MAQRVFWIIAANPSMFIFAACARAVAERARTGPHKAQEPKLSKMTEDFQVQWRKFNNAREPCQARIKASRATRRKCSRDRYKALAHGFGPVVSILGPRI